jgi:hypothetical protein
VTSQSSLLHSRQLSLINDPSSVIIGLIVTHNSSLLVSVNSLTVTCFDGRNFSKLLNGSPILGCHHFENLSKRSTHIMDTDVQTFYTPLSTSVSNVMHSRIDSTGF